MVRITNGSDWIQFNGSLEALLAALGLEIKKKYKNGTVDIQTRGRWTHVKVEVFE